MTIRWLLLVALAGCRPSCAKSIECLALDLDPVVWVTRELRCVDFPVWHCEYVEGEWQEECFAPIRYVP